MNIRVVDHVRVLLKNILNFDSVCDNIILTQLRVVVGLSDMNKLHGIGHSILVGEKTVPSLMEQYRFTNLTTLSVNKDVTNTINSVETMDQFAKIELNVTLKCVINYV